MLKTDIKPGTTLEIGDIRIRVNKKHGQLVSIAIDAPKSMPILLKDESGNVIPRKTDVSLS